jgi:branched-chain amino acid transport system permease protein
MSGARRAGGVALTGLLAVALVLLPFALKDYRVYQLNLVLVYAIAVLGLNLLTGTSGQISLGHGAFFAIGGYAAALLVERAGMPWWTAPPAAAALGFGAGVLMGFPALRLAGHHLALATFALALAVPQLLKFRHLAPLTGGAQGIVLAKPEPPFAGQLFGRQLDSDRWLYMVTLAVTALLFALAWNLLRSRVGRALVAIRDHPLAASATGIYLARFKTLIFGVSAAYTAVAGALGALVVGFVSPDSYTVFLSISLLVGVVVGGLGSIAGAFFGAAFIQFVPNVANAAGPSAPWALYGLLLIACMLLLPTGVMGGLRRLRQAWAARRPATIAPP